MAGVCHESNSRNTLKAKNDEEESEKKEKENEENQQHTKRHITKNTKHLRCVYTSLFLATYFYAIVSV